MKLPLALLAVAALAACSPKAQQSVENQFDQTGNAIENTANTLEAVTENASKDAAGTIENAADDLENRVDAIDVVPSNRAGAGGK
jgi:hypothetical protein